MAAFDPYYKWLGIPPEEQPADHYRLLGLRRFEPDPEVIEAAAERIVSYLQTVATGEYVAESQRLLNEVAAARRCLLTAERRTAYDQELPTQHPDVPPAPPPPPPFDLAQLKAERSRTAAKKESRPPTRTVVGPTAPDLSPQARKRRRAFQIAAGCGAAVVLALGGLIWSLSSGPKTPGPTPPRRPPTAAASDSATAKPTGKEIAAKPGTVPLPAKKEPAVLATFEPPEEDVFKWRAANAKGKVSAGKGTLVLEGTGATTFDVPAVTGELQLELRVRHPAGGKARVFWTEKDNPTFDIVRSADVEIKGGDWHAAWGTLLVRSPLTGLRIDPPPGDAPLELDFVHIRGAGGKPVKEWGFGAPATPGRSTKSSR